MASVRITVTTGDYTYEIERDYPETMSQAHGSDKWHIDRLVDDAVTRVKAAYRTPNE